MTKHILMMGKPGVGKTTLIEKIISSLHQEYPHLKITGFLTKEVRSKGVRSGFDIHTLNGLQGVLARTLFDDSIQRKRVGKYSVDLVDLETIGIPSLKKNADFIILDEIGKMELFSQKFKDALKLILDGKAMVLATIAWYDTPDTKWIKELPNIKILEVTRQNRDQLLIEIMNLIKILFNI